MGQRSPTYLSWTSMKARCNNSRLAAYGGRGIKYDPKWQRFEAFLLDMGIRPEGKTLDRIDPMKNYQKSNCRWATELKQANNKRETKTLYFNFEHYGREGSPAEWARYLRVMTSNPKWTVRNLHACLRTMTLDQIVCAVHPAQITPQELLRRHEASKQTKEQKEVEDYFKNLLAACP